MVMRARRELLRQQEQREERMKEKEKDKEKKEAGAEVVPESPQSSSAGGIADARLSEDNEELSPGTPSGSKSAFGFFGMGEKMKAAVESIVNPQWGGGSNLES